MIRPTRADPALRTQDSRLDEGRAPALRPDHDTAEPAWDDQPLAASWDPPVGPKHGSDRLDSRLVRAVNAYGWRVWAVSVLAALTVLVVIDVARSPLLPGHARESDPERSPLISNPVSGPGFAAAKVSAELPGGGPFSLRGAGTWRVIPGAAEPFGGGQLFTYTVEIEDGVELEGGPAGFAATVDGTLRNPKSWIGSGRYQFQRIDDARSATFRISLTSQETTRRLCGFRIPFDSSCWKPEDRRVVISTARWARGAVAFEGNIVQYQQYVVNHEAGHALGFSHIACDGPGHLAPVMMQQTWGVADDYLAALNTDHVSADGLVCQPNAWPFPTVN